MDFEMFSCMFTDTLEIRMELGEVIVTITDADGKVVTQPSPPPTTLTIAQLAINDSAVAKAMRVMASDGTSWVGLYRIHEVVEDDVGEVGDRGCWLDVAQSGSGVSGTPLTRSR
jgi:hypothetical protein